MTNSSMHTQMFQLRFRSLFRKGRGYDLAVTTRWPCRWTSWRTG